LWPRRVACRASIKCRQAFKVFLRYCEQQGVTITFIAL
jgi:hypothetical protein